MIGLYLVTVFLVHTTDSTSRFIEGINVCFASGASGTVIFFYGLAIAAILDLISN